MPDNRNKELNGWDKQMHFLERIATKFLSEYGENIHRLAFVFPTRRAGLYFQHHLDNLKGDTPALWAPKVYSGNDFMVDLSGLTIPDSIELIFTLYDIYHREIRNYPREFEDFYSWGNMILSDFDEIDKQLIDPGKLFRTLKEFKAIEEIDKDEKASIYLKYTSFWEDLGFLYQEFNRVLAGKQAAYEGMAFRRVAEGLPSGSMDLPSFFRWEKVIFCGFNALTHAEEQLIKYLLSEGKAEIFWDMDRYFVEDGNQEAGVFFRHNRHFFGNEHCDWVDDHLSEERKITITGSQTKVGQAKVLGLKLEQLLKSQVAPEDIAVVLPDETMLFPVLNSLPQKMKPVNITIGYPLEQTPVYSLLYAVLEMQSRGRQADDKPANSPASGHGKTQPVFSFNDLYRVLNHPYIKAQAPDKVKAIVNGAKLHNVSYLDLAKCKEVLRSYILEKEGGHHSKGSTDAGASAEIDVSLPPAIEALFKEYPNASEMIIFFLELLGLIREFFQPVDIPATGDATGIVKAAEADGEKEERKELLSIDYEYIYHFYTLLTRLQDALRSTGVELRLDAFRRLFADIIKNSRIPFTGEPLEGMQIMGVLETQALHFDHIFVLSLNEGYLPPGRSHHSFIPFDVRIAIGLPTVTEHDAVAAYHFYRLLKNSEQTELIYITEAKGMEKTEKSRFIDQLLIEFAAANPQAQISHQVVDFAFAAQEVKPIAIEKSAQVLATLKERSYSASSLLDYITCSLKFYFSRVLRLKEEDEVFESPDQRLTGDIMHDTLKELYNGWEKPGKVVSYQDIEKVQQQIPVVLTSVFMDKMYKEKNSTNSERLQTGRNRVIFEVMKKFLEQFFEKEKRNAGFKVLMLEEAIEKIPLSFHVNGEAFTVQLQGKIDRVDVDKDGICRVIDYKTGKVNSLELPAMDALTGPKALDRRECFQLFFYRYLLASQDREKGSTAGCDMGNQEYRLGIYPFKKLNDELLYVTVNKNDRIDDTMVTAFKQVLVSLFAEIFDPNVPFTQAEDEKNCRYCPYINICSRTEVESFG